LKNQYILSSLAILILAGCGSMTNRASSDLIPISALSSNRDGIVIFSTGAQGPCVVNATVAFVFDGITNKRVDDAPWISMDIHNMKSEFSGYLGAVDAMVLPAGKYYIEPRFGNVVITTIKSPKFSFNVVPGETVYLGQIYMPRSCVQNTNFIIKDEYARDVEMAASRNSVFSQRTPIKRLFKIEQK